MSVFGRNAVAVGLLALLLLLVAVPVLVLGIHL